MRKILKVFLSLILGLSIMCFFDNDIEATNDVVYTTVSAAATYLRKQMVNRENKVVIKYKGNVAVAEKIYQEAVKHTGIGDEGDYIIWHRIKNGYSNSYNPITNIKTITYTMTWRTTKVQEEKISKKLMNIMNNMNLEGKSDYFKVRTIFHYIVNNVSYNKSKDQNDLEKYTTYGALFNGNAVCQGFSTLFYRMCLDAGVDCRFIKGLATNSSDHGWNIVQLNGKYYNVDTAWDSFNTPYSFQYFLKGSNTFNKEHTVKINNSTLKFLLNQYKTYDSKISKADFNYEKEDAKDLVINGKCGTNITWTYSHKTKTLTISGNGKIPNFVTEKTPLKLAPWKYLPAQKIVINSGITSIGNSAFYGFTSLKNVSISSSVTSIGKLAFYNCDSLKNITIPSSVKTIGSNALGYKYKSKTSNTKIANYTITTTNGSAAEKYAIKYRFNYKVPVKELSAPHLKSVKNDNGKITLKWTSVNKASGYKIYRICEGEQTYKAIATTSKLTYTDTSQKKAGKFYTYYIVAYNGATKGKKSEKKGYRYLSIPTIISLTKQNKGVLLKWKKSSNTNVYYVYRRLSGQKAWTKIVATKNLQFTDKTVKLGKTYEYYVKAVCGNYTSSILTKGKKIKYTK